MPLTLDELWVQYRRERRWLIGLFSFDMVTLAILIYLQYTSANAIRLYTITTAPSYVPISVIQYLIVYGALIGAGLAVGIIAFAQLFRTGRVWRQIQAMAPAPPTPGVNAPWPRDHRPYASRWVSPGGSARSRAGHEGAAPPS